MKGGMEMICAGGGRWRWGREKLFRGRDEHGLGAVGAQARLERGDAGTCLVRDHLLERRLEGLVQAVEAIEHREPPVDVRRMDAGVPSGAARCACEAEHALGRTAAAFGHSIDLLNNSGMS